MIQFSWPSRLCLGTLSYPQPWISLFINHEAIHMYWVALHNVCNQDESCRQCTFMGKDDVQWSFKRCLSLFREAWQLLMKKFWVLDLPWFQTALQLLALWACTAPCKSSPTQGIAHSSTLGWVLPPSSPKELLRSKWSGSLYSLKTLSQLSKLLANCSIKPAAADVRSCGVFRSECMETLFSVTFSENQYVTRIERVHDCRCGLCGFLISLHQK